MPDRAPSCVAVPPSPPAAPSTSRALTVLVLTLVLCAGAIWGVLYLKELQTTHPGRVERILQSPWALPGLFLVSLLSNATLFMPVPGLLLSASAGNFIAGWLVGVVAGLGQTLGEITGYAAGYSGRRVVGRRRAYQRAQGWIRRNQRVGSGFLFVMAVVPNPLFDAAGLAAGMLRFPLWKFLAAVGLGKVLKNILMAYFGLMFMRWITWSLV
jgi:membrane protein YqaA with SNARE-associated domain